MVIGRKSEELEDDRKKWKIYFDKTNNFPGAESFVEIIFRKNNNESPYIKMEDIEKLKQDLKDLGKLRIIKQGKDFLEK